MSINGEEFVKISRRQLAMFYELINLQIDAKLNSIPWIDGLSDNQEVGAGEVKRIRIVTIENIALD